MEKIVRHIMMTDAEFCAKYPLKTCTCCGQRKPRDTEHYHKYAGRSIDGLRPICKECNRSADAERKRRSRAKARAAKIALLVKKPGKKKAR